MAGLDLIVVDTTVFVDALRGYQPARTWLLELERRLVASEVSRIEILRGLRSNERARAEALFHAFSWVPVDESIARRAGNLGREFRRSHSLSIADLIIAATAQELGTQLATSNVRDYPMFPDLAPPY